MNTSRPPLASAAHDGRALKQRLGTIGAKSAARLLTGSSRVGGSPQGYRYEWNSEQAVTFSPSSRTNCGGPSTGRARRLFGRDRGGTRTEINMNNRVAGRAPLTGCPPFPPAQVAELGQHTLCNFSDRRPVIAKCPRSVGVEAHQSVPFLAHQYGEGGFRFVGKSGREIRNVRNV